MEMTPVNISKIYMEHYQDEDEYIKARLRRLGVDANLDFKMFHMKSRGGFYRSP